ncbi:MAG: dTMP kinase [Candidatus Omnitrophica bacterium]|nr:dTMP kinase [Candidatus Omnitrophota bacterium]
MKGKFITFEGSEGSGKSTQSGLLVRYLKREGVPVLFLREPGGTAISEKIRKILLDHKNDSMSASCELLLYMASRAQVVAEVIKPHLSNGTVVICDRFLDSTIAYQGYGLGMDLKLIRYMGNLATQGIQPDLTVFLDVPVKDGLKHRHLHEDRIEKRPLSYHERVRRGYLRIAKSEPSRFKIVRLEEEKSATQKKIRELVTKLLTAQCTG